MEKVSPKGIVLALALTLALDTIAGLAMMVFMGQSAFQRGMTEQQTSEAIAAVTRGTDFLLGSVILGTLSTLVGGYVAARVAKREPYLNAGAIGVLGIVLGMLMPGNYPLWFDLSGLLLVLPAALLGGHLAKPCMQGNA